MTLTEHIGPHEYSFNEGIFSFTPLGVVLPEHATQLVAFFRQHSQPTQPLFCLFDLTGSPSPIPEARRIVVEYLRSDKPLLVIATHGAPLRLRAMLALVSGAARVIGGYHLRITHFEQREGAIQYLRRTPPA